MLGDDSKKPANSVVHEIVNKRWEVCVTTSMKGFQQASFVNSIATTKVHYRQLSQLFIMHLTTGWVPKASIFAPRLNNTPMAGITPQPSHEPPRQGTGTCHTDISVERKEREGREEETC